MTQLKLLPIELCLFLSVKRGKKDSKYDRVIKEFLQHNADIETRKKIGKLTICIVDYESYNRIPIESFKVETVFEDETTLQHPYEFVEKIHYNIPMNQKQELETEFQIFLTFLVRIKIKSKELFGIWCSLDYYQ